MMKGLIMDENMSNLTSASGEISASSGSRTETGTMYPQQSFASTANQAPPTNKKKRSLPGNPDPDAEVIALSPKSLLATNRFICEICNKGFQRDQNLQLHRRGHNLPWKLKQRAKQEVVRKKVYVCPEPTCVHHEPSRALGDLTGIKKHFCRKHGEKKWKCEKCSKRYAVQSDWKAHSKICGTREYRCDCGTIFSRRDSFITHRAFCDALTEESARAITTANPLLSAHHQPGSSSAASHMINLQCLTVKREQESHLLYNPRPDNINFPPWFACPPVGEAGPGPPPPQHISLSSQLFPTSSLDQSFLQHENPSPNPSSSHSHLPPFQSISSSTASPHMSATALLQKAAQMGVNMSKPSASSAASTSSMLRPHQTHMSAGNSSTAGFSSTSATTSTATAAGSGGLGLPSREDIGGGGFSHHLSSFGNKAAAAVTSSGIMDQMAVAGAGTASLVHDIMSSLSPPGGYGGSSFGESFDGMFNPSGEAAISKSSAHGSRAAAAAVAAGGRGGGNDGLTRDFLGLKAFPNKNFLNIAGLDHMNSSSSAPPTYGGQQHHQSQHHQAPWQG